MKKLFVLCAAVIFVVAFTAPSFAAEWSFYGSARMTMFWTNQDWQDTSSLSGEDDTNTMGHALQGNSRIGANVKAGDNLTGRFEFGTSDSTVNTRIIWGEYDFGGFQLGVGQHYTPVFYLISNQVFDSDNDLVGFGGVYEGRKGMVRAKMGGFQFALVTPQASTTIADPAGGGYVGLDTEISWPKLEASYLLKAGGFSMKFMGGYNQYKVLGADQSETLSSYVGALGAQFNAGPFMVGGDIFYGKNLENFGFATGNNGMAGWDTVDEKLLDNTGLGWMFVAAFTMSDMFRFEGGLGQSNYTMDNTDDDDTNSSWYVQATIAFAKGVFIVPEIGQQNNGTNFAGDKEPKLTYYGLKWQINF